MLVSQIKPLKNPKSSVLNICFESHQMYTILLNKYIVHINISFYNLHIFQYT